MVIRPWNLTQIMKSKSSGVTTYVVKDSTDCLNTNVVAVVVKPVLILIAEADSIFSYGRKHTLP